MDELEPRDARLDELLRPALLVDPPPGVQRSILAAVLASAAAAPAIARQPVAAVAPTRSVPAVAYLLLGAALLAYVGVVSWLQGVLGGASWLGTLARQLLVVADLVVGQPLPTDPLTLIWLVLQSAPWLALLPIALLLWNRDRAGDRALPAAR